MNAVGEEYAARLNADDAGVFKPVEVFDELVAQPFNGECEPFLTQYDTLLIHWGKDKFLGKESKRVFVLAGVSGKRCLNGVLSAYCNLTDVFSFFLMKNFTKFYDQKLCY